jgi:hypothetical protein
MKYLKYFFAGLMLFGGATIALASVTFSTPTQPVDTYKNFTFFTATTTTATSTNTTDGGGYFIIAGAKKVVMYFTHGGTATTSTTGSTFKVQTTRDGLVWADFNKLLGADVSSTATSTYAIQGATSTVPVALDLSDDGFFAVRCISVEFAGVLATDGEQTCAASAEF